MCIKAKNREAAQEQAKKESKQVFVVTYRNIPGRKVYYVADDLKSFATKITSAIPTLDTVHAIAGL